MSSPTQADYSPTRTDFSSVSSAVTTSPSSTVLSSLANDGESSSSVSPGTSASTSLNSNAITSIVLGILLATIIVALILFFWRRRLQRNRTPEQGAHTSSRDPSINEPSCSVQEVDAVTRPTELLDEQGRVELFDKRRAELDGVKR